MGKRKDRKIPRKVGKKKTQSFKRKKQIMEDKVEEEYVMEVLLPKEF